MKVKITLMDNDEEIEYFVFSHDSFEHQIKDRRLAYFSKTTVKELRNTKLVSEAVMKFFTLFNVMAMEGDSIKIDYLDEDD